MSIQRLKENAGETFVQTIENGVKELIADRILPGDFVIKEIREDCAWGMSDGLVVAWDLQGHALSAVNDADAVMTSYISYNGDKEEWELTQGVELWPNAIYDIIY